MNVKTIPLNEALDILKYIHLLKVNSNELESTVGLVLSKENTSIYISLDKNFYYKCIIHNTAKTFSCISQDEKDVLVMCSYLAIHTFSQLNFDKLLIDDNFLVPNKDDSLINLSIKS